MRTRLKWSIFSIAALLIGALDYALYRQDTYIGAIFPLPALPFHWGYDFFAYYFPDFLWALSLSFGLFAILAPNKNKTMLCSIITSAYGGFWELLQHIGLVSGTADWVDICMYITAVLTAVMIKYSILRRD